jgi:hypothetical protein
VTAVAVWQQRPAADDLLAHRVAQGWTPTPSQLADGERILGHARACGVYPAARREPGHEDRR